MQFGFEKHRSDTWDPKGMFSAPSGHSVLVKKLEIEETKTTWYSTFKTDILRVGLVFSISNFFITKTSLTNKLMRKKIPSCSNLALNIGMYNELGT